MLETLKEELQKNWIKVILLIILCVYLYATVDHVKEWLTKSQQPQILVTTDSSGKDKYITPSGGTTVNAPPVYITIPQQSTESTSVSVKPKDNPKTSADVVLDESKTKYLFQYKNGFTDKTYEVKPTVTEDYKFQNGQLVIDRTVTNKTSVSVPTPVGGLGAGFNLEGRPALGWSGRIGKTTANLQVITDFQKQGSTFFMVNNNVYK